MDRSKIIIFILAVLVLAWLLNALLAHAQHEARGSQNARQALINHADIAMVAAALGAQSLAANPST